MILGVRAVGRAAWRTSRGARGTEQRARARGAPHPGVMAAAGGRDSCSLGLEGRGRRLLGLTGRALGQGETGPCGVVVQGGAWRRGGLGRGELGARHAGGPRGEGREGLAGRVGQKEKKSRRGAGPAWAGQEGKKEDFGPREKKKDFLFMDKGIWD